MQDDNQKDDDAELEEDSGKNSGKNSGEDSSKSPSEDPGGHHLDEKRNLVKRGDEINITHKDPTMKQIMVGVGWDLKKFESHPLDLDVSVFLLDKDDKTRVDGDFIFYNNHIGADAAVKHSGDSRTGAGEGDDEIVLIDLNVLPFDILKVVFVVSIYNFDYEAHDFTMVKNVYFRIINQRTSHELFRYELDEELSGEEGLIIGVLERVGAEWIFHAVGDTVHGGLGKIAQDYGIIVAEHVEE